MLVDILIGTFIFLVIIGPVLFAIIYALDPHA